MAEQTDKTPSRIARPAGSPFTSTALHFRKPVIILAHIGTFAAALLLAFLFAFNMQILRKWIVFPYPIILTAVLLIKLPVFGSFKQFRGWWRYVGITDLFRIAKASLFSAAVLICLWYAYSYFGDKFIPDSAITKIQQKIDRLKNGIDAALTRQQTFPLRRDQANFEGLLGMMQVTRIRQLTGELEKMPLNSDGRLRLELQIGSLRDIQRSIEAVLMLDLLTTIAMLSGLRMVIRLYHEEFFAETRGPGKRFLIIGAGNAGEALLREMHRQKDSRHEVIGFIDDDPAKKGVDIHGIPVLGTVDNLPDVCKKHNIEEIAIAMPSATRSQMRRVVQTCQGTKVKFSTVPSITDIASGKYRVSQIRDVDINDLLGREVVNLDMNQISSFLRSKVILVTGAGGSIGAEMCRQVCAFSPGRLLLVEQAENPLFFIERELRQNFPSVHLTSLICDIADKQRVDQIFGFYRPQIVIHAAAHKHVPLMEINPGEAVKNNVIGTRNVADAAAAAGSEGFVMISTDKAVNPTSIMGSSKRIAEMYIQYLNNTCGTHFITVRFGNVLGSNGSVVPIFKQQIAAGGPVTVTDPRMCRYFMTIPEASQLVLQAAAMGQGGEIFLLDMGEPVKVVDLARELITLSGFRPGEDIEIAFTGLRPGEKLFEELSIKGEDMLATKHPKIAVWKNIPKDRKTLLDGIDKLLTVAQSQDHGKIVEVIKELVPNYIGQPLKQDSAGA